MGGVCPVSSHWLSIRWGGADFRRRSGGEVLYLLNMKAIAMAQYAPSRMELAS